jgi:3,4-dihydroxy 2-butanone 4-phosphate synthase / GTP cyclohydrolase II
MKTKFSKIEEAIEDIRNGKMVVVVDDEDRENEGDIIMAAEKITPEAINFMVKHAGGLICMPVDENRMKELNIDIMVSKNTDSRQTAFTVSVDWYKVKTGISAHERALTILKIIDPSSKPGDFSRPGHIFPLIAKEYGVLQRAGHTEAAVDLAKLAGLYPAGVICEIMNNDGSMARLPDLEEYIGKHDIKMITIADLIEYRRQQECIIEREATVNMPTLHGEFIIHGFVNKITGDHHLALTKGNITDGCPVLVRIHSECLTGDVFGSRRCDCGEQLQEALRRIEENGKGVLLYLRQEGRGIGLINKLKAYELQEDGLDTVEANLALGFKADLRDFGVAAEMLANLGVRKIILMTNNPMKIKGVSAYGIEVVDRQPLEMTHNEQNLYYLQTKLMKLGHMLHV